MCLRGTTAPERNAGDVLQMLDSTDVSFVTSFVLTHMYARTNGTQNSKLRYNARVAGCGRCTRIRAPLLTVPVKTFGLAYDILEGPLWTSFGPDRCLQAACPLCYAFVGHS